MGQLEWWLKVTGYEDQAEGRFVCLAVRSWARPYLWLKRCFPRLP